MRLHHVIKAGRAGPSTAPAVSQTNLFLEVRMTSYEVSLPDSGMTLAIMALCGLQKLVEIKGR